MIKRYARTAISQYIILILIIAVIVGFGFLSHLVMKEVPFVDDFAIPWAAGRVWLLEGQNPYTMDLSGVAQRSIEESGYLAELPTNKILLAPLFNLIFYLPFSLIPYEISRAIWVTMLLICLGMITHFAFKLSGWKLSRLEKSGIILLSLFWFPGLYAILTGQLSPVIILLVLIAIFLLIQNQDTTAGFFLALTFGSLPITLLTLILILVWSISHRRWSVVIAYFSGVVFLFLIGWMMLPSWPTDWVRNLFNFYSDWSLIQTPVMVLASNLPGISKFLYLAVHLLFGLYLLVLWVTSVRAPERVFIWKALMVLVVSFFFQIQFEQSFLLLIIPALYLVSRFWSERWGILGKIISWVVMLSIAVGSWIVILPGIEFQKNSSPILMITGLPFATFLGMLWVRWWALNIARYPYGNQ